MTPHSLAVIVVLSWIGQFVFMIGRRELSPSPWGVVIALPGFVATVALVLKALL